MKDVALNSEQQRAVATRGLPLQTGVAQGTGQGEREHASILGHSWNRPGTRTQSGSEGLGVQHSWSALQPWLVHTSPKSHSAPFGLVGKQAVLSLPSVLPQKRPGAQPENES